MREQDGVTLVRLWARGKAGKDFELVEKALNDGLLTALEQGKILYSLSDK